MELKHGVWVGWDSVRVFPVYSVGATVGKGPVGIGTPALFTMYCDRGQGLIGVGAVIATCVASGIGTASESATKLFRACVVVMPHATNVPTMTKIIL